MLEKICEELGVEVGEMWEGIDGNNYRISREGEIFLYDDRGFYTGKRGYSKWENIFKGGLRPVWKPKIGEYYWLADPSEQEKTWRYRWSGLPWEKKVLDRHMVFKTKEEAIDATNKMLEAIKEED